MSYVCLHIPLSLLLFCYFSHAACTQITMHGFSFQLIFPKWEQKWVFSLLPGGTLSGATADLRRWLPRCVFSGQGAVRYSVWHALSSSWDRPKSTLATRAQFYPHVHTPTAWSRSEAASWQGYRVQGLTARKFVPSASVVLTICPTGSQGLSSQVQQLLSQTRLEDTWPQTHTQAQKMQQTLYSDVT